MPDSGLKKKVKRLNRVVVTLSKMMTNQKVRTHDNTMIPDEKRSVILHRLQVIEQEEQVRILLAVESGSRAWGFPSQDSDYDVRFIYVRPQDWYLSFQLEAKPDTIERPIVDEFDCAGWDIRKAFKLFLKSNPPLLEWLDSDLIYLDRHGFAENMRALRSAFFSPQACAYHYLHMAQGNFRSYLQGTEVWTKKYFYVLRPLLAVRWIEQQRGPVPMSFHQLLATIEHRPDLQKEIEQLLVRKMAGDELAQGPAIPAIQEFLHSELTRLEGWQPYAHRDKFDLERLDELFREMLRLAWRQE